MEIQGGSVMFEAKILPLSLGPPINIEKTQSRPWFAFCAFTELVWFDVGRSVMEVGHPTPPTTPAQGLNLEVEWLFLGVVHHFLGGAGVLGVAFISLASASSSALIFLVS